MTNARLSLLFFAAVHPQPRLLPCFPRGSRTQRRTPRDPLSPSPRRAPSPYHTRAPRHARLSPQGRDRKTAGSHKAVRRIMDYLIFRPEPPRGCRKLQGRVRPTGRPYRAPQVPPEPPQKNRKEPHMKMAPSPTLFVALRYFPPRAFSAVAISASMKALLNPFCCSTRHPAIVVPPGVHTASFS